jgi:hypothetical protein
MTEPLNIEYRARRLWAFHVAVWLAAYLPSRVGFALARIIARLIVIVEFRLGPREAWRPVPVDESLS